MKSEKIREEIVFEKNFFSWEVIGGKKNRFGRSSGISGRMLFEGFLHQRRRPEGFPTKSSTSPKISRSSPRVGRLSADAAPHGGGATRGALLTREAYLHAVRICSQKRKTSALGVLFHHVYPTLLITKATGTLDNTSTISSADVRSVSEPLKQM